MAKPGARSRLRTAWRRSWRRLSKVMGRLMCWNGEGLTCSTERLCEPPINYLGPVSVRHTDRVRILQTPPARQGRPDAISRSSIAYGRWRGDAAIFSAEQPQARHVHVSSTGLGSNPESRGKMASAVPLLGGRARCLHDAAVEILDADRPGARRSDHECGSRFLRRRQARSIRPGSRRQGRCAPVDPRVRFQELHAGCHVAGPIGEYRHAVFRADEHEPALDWPTPRLS